MGFCGYNAWLLVYQEAFFFGPSIQRKLIIVLKIESRALDGSHSYALELQKVFSTKEVL